MTTSVAPHETLSKRTHPITFIGVSCQEDVGRLGGATPSVLPIKEIMESKGEEMADKALGSCCGPGSRGVRCKVMRFNRRERIH